MWFVCVIGHVTNDVTWLQKIKLVTPIHSAHSISKTVGERPIRSKGLPTGNGLWSMKWSHHRWRQVTPVDQTRDPNSLIAQYLELENSWRCYLATIANCYLVCCEAVRSAILATAWLRVLQKTGVCMIRRAVWRRNINSFLFARWQYRHGVAGFRKRYQTTQKSQDT